MCAPLQSTANDPVVLDHSWIFDKMKALMVDGKFVLEPRALQVRQGLGALQDLCFVPDFQPQYNASFRPIPRFRQAVGGGGWEQKSSRYLGLH